jgi:hypothetical protein
MHCSHLKLQSRTQYGWPSVAIRRSRLSRHGKAPGPGRKPQSAWLERHTDLIPVHVAALAEVQPSKVANIRILNFKVTDRIRLPLWAAFAFAATLWQDVEGRSELAKPGYTLREGGIAHPLE